MEPRGDQNASEGAEKGTTSSHKGAKGRAKCIQHLTFGKHNLKVCKAAFPPPRAYMRLWCCAGKRDLKPSADPRRHDCCEIDTCSQHIIYVCGNMENAVQNKETEPTGRAKVHQMVSKGAKREPKNVQRATKMYPKVDV